MRPDVQPFLSATSSEVRPLLAALPAIETEPAISPWTPQPAPAAAAPAAPGPHVELARAEAVAAGHAEGLERGRAEGREELALAREQLRTLLAELEAARRELTEVAVDHIASAAAAVVGAWTQAAEPRELFAPVVRAWLARGPVAATVRVCPAQLAAAREAIGDAELVVEPDPALAPGDLRITAATAELVHVWERRLEELREAIATRLVAARGG